MSRTRKVDSDAGQGTPTGEPTSGILRTACRFSPRRQSTKNRALSAAHVCRVVVLKIAETHPLRYGAGQRSSRGNAARPPPPPPAEVDVEVVILIKQRVRSLESPVSITNWEPPTPQDGYDYHHLSTGVCQREQCGPDRGAGRGVPLPRPHLCLAAGLCQGGYGEGVWR